MTTFSNCALYSDDNKFTDKVNRVLDGICKTQVFSSSTGFEKLLGRMAPGLVIVDLQAPEALRHISSAQKRGNDLLVVALGEPKSVMIREAEALGVYAAEGFDLDHKKLRELADRAFSQINLQHENQNLRERVIRETTNTISASTPTFKRASNGQLANFSRSLRHLDDLNALLESIIEGICSSTLVSRVGVFLRNREDGIFRLASSMRCLPDATTAEYTEDNPLVLWMEQHACQISRANLEHISDIQSRLLLQQELDLFGAEIIVPLQGRREMLGWLFLGNRATGMPFSQADMAEFMVLADHVSTTLENALLYEEVAVQKTMAETLLHAIPSGICAVDTTGTVRAINQPAEAILGVRREVISGQDVSQLGSRLADILLRTLEDGPQSANQWTDPNTQRILQVESRPLIRDGQCSGAMALIQDITEEQRLQDKQDQVERGLFWNDLAASMSHEIRNPLVAIKTFAQLLPDRYEDSDFRAEFGKLVTAEVDRLNSIIEQIDGFAHPDPLDFCLLDLTEVILAGIDASAGEKEKNGTAINVSFDPNLPKIQGDRNALTECFTHLVRNALEAVEDEPNGQIHLVAKRKKVRNKPDTIAITIEDNGQGVAGEIWDNIFSPFCTTKAAGMGLGLPIAKRTIVDHSGEILVEKTEPGTRVTIALPTRKRSASL